MKKFKLTHTVKEGIARLQDEVHDDDHLNNFISCHESGGVSDHFNQACYSDLNYDSEVLTGTIAFIVGMPDGKSCHKKRLSHALTIPYLKWLKNDSPYASCILNKTVKSMWKDGMIVSCHSPTNLMMQCLTLYRYVWEYPEVVDLCVKLMKKGVHGNTAILFSHYFRRNKGGTYKYNQRSDGGHYAFSADKIGIHTLKRMFTGEEADSATYYQHPKYSGVTETFGDGYDTLIDEEDIKTVKSIGEDYWGDKVITRTITQASLLKQLTTIANRLEKEIGHV